MRFDFWCKNTCRMINLLAAGPETLDHHGEISAASQDAVFYHGVIMSSGFAGIRHQKSFVRPRVPPSGVTLLCLGLSFHCGEKVGERSPVLLKQSQ